LEVDQYGTATTATLYKPVVESGCPFCGSLNWKGEF
jgi:hypothetical protein